ncbi:TPA: hypothetical protein HA251_07325 [Candidatus Woesearchaeota archaeon]|nr:hypothetical protein [Candidatus Woesearchaeota archaeon]
MGRMHPLTMLGLALMACLTVVAVAGIITGQNSFVSVGSASAGSRQQIANTAPSMMDATQNAAPSGHTCGSGGGGCGCGG